MSNQDDADDDRKNEDFLWLMLELCALHSEAGPDVFLAARAEVFVSAKAAEFKPEIETIEPVVQTPPPPGHSRAFVPSTLRRSFYPWAQVATPPLVDTPTVSKKGRADVVLEEMPNGDAPMAA